MDGLEMWLSRSASCNSPGQSSDKGSDYSRWLQTPTEDVDLPKESGIHRWLNHSALEVNGSRSMADENSRWLADWRPEKMPTSKSDNLSWCKVKVEYSKWLLNAMVQPRKADDDSIRSQPDDDIDKRQTVLDDSGTTGWLSSNSQGPMVTSSWWWWNRYSSHGSDALGQTFVVEKMEKLDLNGEDERGDEQMEWLLLSPEDGRSFPDDASSIAVLDFNDIDHLSESEGAACEAASWLCL